MWCQPGNVTISHEMEVRIFLPDEEARRRAPAKFAFVTRLHFHTDQERKLTMAVDPKVLENAKNAPVNFLLGLLQNNKTGYFLDGDDHPCLEIEDDPDRKLRR